MPKYLHGKMNCQIQQVKFEFLVLFGKLNKIALGFFSGILSNGLVQEAEAVDVLYKLWASVAE